MAFLTPFFLLGAAAAALPVLVHLVRRTQAQRIEFPSLMFLRRIEQKTIKKRKLRNLLLLALRSAALALLALAFARPYFTSQNPAASGSERASSVILIDGSYSMRYANLFDRARQSARDIINRAGSDEQMAVVQFGQGYDILMPLKANRAEALALVDQIQPGLEATDYLQALQAADAMLKESARGERRIYLISDFQAAGWNRAAPQVKLSPLVDLIAVDISSADSKNVAVSEVKADPVVYAQKYGGKVSARLNNFGLDEVGDAVVDLKLNELAVERRQSALDSAGSRAVEFTGFNVPEGANRATVEITGDEFPLDNKFYFMIRREDQTKVLAIETPSRGRSETFFIQQSLAAGENNQHALTVKTPGTINPAELDQYRAIIVNDITGVSDQLGSAIKSFVERGGGLIIAAGKHAEAAEFNRVFRDVSPAELGEKVQTRGYALMSQVKMDHPIFSAFRKSGRLTSTRVYGYHRVNAGDRASTIAALDDGSPMIIEGLLGRGKVLLVTTTLDTAWNDLPLTPMFLPFVRQMLEYLDGRVTATSYTVGQVFAVAPDTDGSLPTIESPAGGRIEDAPKNPSGELAVNAAEIGFYRLRYRDRIEHIAVNLDTKESDFAKLDIDEFKASILPAPGDRAAGADQIKRLTAAEIESQQRLWLPLLILALALFLSEAILAHHIRIARLVG
jgi:uncharacterized membrane protein